LKIIMNNIPLKMFLFLCSTSFWAVSQIEPYLQSPTENSLYISWHSSASSESQVVFGTSSNMSDSKTGQVHKFNTGTWWHSTQLTNLKPNTEYYYQVHSGSESSKVYKFRTQPANDDVKTRIRFISAGDNRSDINQNIKVMAALKAKIEELYGSDIHNQINVFISTGDIVVNGDDVASYTKEYFNPLTNLSHGIPTMVAIGNHEEESANYYNYMKYENFGGGDGEKYYSFRVGPVLFVALNSNGCCRTDKQIIWLTQILEEAQNNPGVHFIFVGAHHPGRSELWPDGNTGWIQNSVIPLLADYSKVEILMYGHSHNYERGAWRTGNLRLLLTGGAGSKLDRWKMYDNQEDYPEIQRSFDYYTYSIFDIDIAAGNYTVKSYGLGNKDLKLDNVLIDTWTRNRKLGPPERPLALAAVSESSTRVRLTGSPFVYTMKIMSSQFQITKIPGDYSTPLLDVHRDWENIYETEGGSEFIPVDKNEGIDLFRLSHSSNLSPGNQYGWRVRYRSQNMSWSQWSTENVFEIQNPGPKAEFALDNSKIKAGESVRFTDLSQGIPIGWEWDFNGDNIVDSRVRDPEFVFEKPGLFSVKLKALYAGNGSQQIVKSDVITVSSPLPVYPKQVSTQILKNAHFYPNPFYGSSKIELDVTGLEDMYVNIYTLQGKIIKVLSPVNFHGSKFIWNGTDSKERAVPPGQYFARFSIKSKMGRNPFIKKIIFLGK